MNRKLQSVFTLLVFAAGALGLSAQAPAIKIVTVDMEKIFENHYKTEEQSAKLNAAKQQAQTELEGMVKDLNQVGEQYKEAMDQSKNTLLTADARTKAESDAQKMIEDIQRRQNDIRQFQVNTSQSLQQRIQNFRSLLLDEISKKVTEIAQRKGATLVVDKSGPTAIGVPTLIYADPSYDITDEVMAEINKDRPPASAAAPAAAPTTAAPAPTPAANPTVSVPGLAK